MSGSILRFKRHGVLGGLVYVVPVEDPGAASTWLLYSQPEGAAEPDLQGTYHELNDAIKAGRQLAIRRGSRFIVDFGEMGEAE